MNNMQGATVKDRHTLMDSLRKRGEMDDLQRAKIKDIKSKVMAMIAERNVLRGDIEAFAYPSEVWSFGCSAIDYMIWLPEEYFTKLRIHTYRFTGDNYQTYILEDPEFWRFSCGIDALTKDIPAALVLNEPEDGIGFHYEDGRFISVDIAKFQRVVNSLYRHRVLENLWASHRRNYVLEIGAGYGGLAHHVTNIVGNVTYVIVDLPETLLYSASYLSLHNPHKKIYVYDAADFSRFMQGRNLGIYDFVLLPNYQLQALRSMRFDLIVNTESLQEMTMRQAEKYLDFISDTCAGVFYSLNRDRVVENTEISSVSELLAERFSLTDLREQNQVSEEPDQPQTNISSQPAISSKVRIRRAIGHVARRIADLIGLSEPEEVQEKVPTEKEEESIPPVRPAVLPPQREYLCWPLTKRESRSSAL